MNTKLPKSVTAIFIVIAVILTGTLTVLTVEQSAVPSSVFNGGQHSSPAVPTATVSALSISKPSGTAAALLGSTRTITWTTSNYSSSVGVNINLIKKVSSSPNSYVLVRKLGVNVPNTGTFTWTPASTDTGSNLYAEVTCAYTSTTPAQTAACQVTSQPIAVN